MKLKLSNGLIKYNDISNFLKNINNIRNEYEIINIQCLIDIGNEFNNLINIYPKLTYADIYEAYFNEFYKGLNLKEKLIKKDREKDREKDKEKDREDDDDDYNIEDNLKKRRKNSKRIIKKTKFHDFEYNFSDNETLSENEDNDNRDKKDNRDNRDQDIEKPNYENLVKIDNNIDETFSFKKYISMKNIARIHDELIEFNNMIGLEIIKQQVIEQLIYLLETDKSNILMHTALFGPPGTGKTTIAKLIGKIYHKLGILKSNIFIVASRKDLVAKYLGQTACKTAELFEKAKGGVLFIDEIYAMGNDSETDSYSKEAIDTIVQMLTEHMDTMCIIAGYKNETEKYFFNLNVGLESRFPWKFTIEPYDHTQLYAIFLLYIKKGEWIIQGECIITEEWFKENIRYFSNGGRDVINYLEKCYIQQNIRLFLQNKNKILINDDFKSGFDILKINKYNVDSDCNKPYHSMYL